MSAIVVRSGGVEYRFAPDQQPITIGRIPSCAVPVNAQAVSSTHAQLTFEGGQWVYRDQSTNGSYVHDTPAPEFAISAPVSVVLGNYEQGAVIEIAPATDATPPPPASAVPPPYATPPPPVGGPPSNPPPATAPPTIGPPMGAPPMGAPPIGPPMGAPPMGAPPMGAPAMGAPAMGAPAMGAPAMGAPPMGAPPGGGERLSSVHSMTQMMPKELPSSPPQTYGAQTQGQDIRIQYLGGEFVAHPGQTVTFGRDPSNDIDLDNPTVSRRHAQLIYTAQGWQLDDMGSSRGLTVDGEATRRVLLKGTTDVWFGPEEAGVRVIFVAPGKSKKKGGVNPLLVVAPVVAVLLIALVAIFAVSRKSTDSATPTTAVPTGVDFTALKKGTVRVEVMVKLTAEQRRRVQQSKKDHGQPDAPDIQGSGTIISSDGLVLTNADVAVPDKMSGGGTKLPPVESFKIVRNPNGTDEQLSEGEDAELVVADTKLDLAVLRINGAQGLPAIPIANDAKVKAGDEIFILGFPGTADTRSVTVTAGKASSFIPDKKLGVDRAWINTDAKVEQGNSGGLAANNQGQIVGIPTLACFDAVQTESGGSGGPIAVQNRVRVIDLASDLIAAAKSGGDYQEKSPDEDVCASGRTPGTRAP